MSAMEPATHPGGRTEPGPHESWEEYFEHSLLHDPLPAPAAEPVPAAALDA
jgi:hypothetical protein